MKTIADTLKVARSNLVEHRQRPPRRRAAYRKADDAWLLPLHYVFLHRRPDAQSVLSQLARWFDDYNEVRPHRGLRMCSPRQFIRSQLSTATCPV